MDISNTSWKENNEGNIEPSPRGLPSGSNPSTLYPTVRYIMGGIKRAWSRSNVMVASTGTGGVWHLSYEVGPANGLVKGEVFRFFAHAASAGATTLNINFNTARPLVNAIGEPLGAGDIVAGQVVSVTFDGTSFRLLSDRGVSPKFTGAVTAGALDVTGNAKVGGTLAATGATTLKVLTADATSLASVTVSGASTLRAVTATTVAASSNATIGGMLAVTGATTLSTVAATSATISGALAAGSATVTGSRVLTLADTGATKGLDADLLDGQHGAFYQNAANLNAGTLPNARLVGDYSFGSLSLTGNLTTHGNTIAVQRDGAKHLWFRNANGGEEAIVWAAGDGRLRLRAREGSTMEIAADGNVLFNGSGGGEWISTIRQRGIDAVNNANGRVAKTGDTMTGDLRISKSYPNLTLFWGGVIHQQLMVDSDGSIVFRNGDNGAIYQRFHTNGAITTAQFGDLASHINNRAYAYSAERVNEIRTVSEFTGSDGIDNVVAGTIVIAAGTHGGGTRTRKAYLQIHRPDRLWSTMWRH